MRVGVLGGGQLGRMLALAGYPLGIRFRFLEPKAESPVTLLGEVIEGAYDDARALERFADGLDVVTYEFENVPVESACLLEKTVPVLPPPSYLEFAQDRIAEKDEFTRLGISTPDYRQVDERTDLVEAARELGLPGVLKTRRLGYDGKGQRVIRGEDDLDDAWDALGGIPLIYERFVDFDRELSILGVRSREGEVRFYPLIENHHREGILRLSIAPAPEVTPELQTEAERLAVRILEDQQYVGILAVELFQVGSDLMANEIAPRVHNSGHWTQDGAVCSQFENHLRAVCGLPLGSTNVLGHTAMVNLIGSIPNLVEVLSQDETHLHLYDKEPRPGRKLGHVNVVASTQERLTGMHRRLESLLSTSYRD